MEVHLLYFGALKELACRAEATWALPEESLLVAELRPRLAEFEPALSGRLGAVRIAVNEVFADETTRVCSGDTVALIPPVAGG